MTQCIPEIRLLSIATLYQITLVPVFGTTAVSNATLEFQ